MNLAGIDLDLLLVFDAIMQERHVTRAGSKIGMPVYESRLESEAPGISVRLVPSAGRTFEVLDAQEIDFGLSAFADIPERFGSLALIEDSYVLIMQQAHPLLNKVSQRICQPRTSG